MMEGGNVGWIERGPFNGDAFAVVEPLSEEHFAEGAIAERPGHPVAVGDRLARHWARASLASATAVVDGGQEEERQMIGWNAAPPLDSAVGFTALLPSTISVTCRHDDASVCQIDLHWSLTPPSPPNPPAHCSRVRALICTSVNAMNRNGIRSF